MLGRILAGFINFFTGLAALFLGLRVLLRLFGANTEAAFVRWIYDSSGVLLQPFRGMFPTETVSPGHVVDFSALFACVVYGLLGLVLLSLIAYLTPGEVVVGKAKR